MTPVRRSARIRARAPIDATAHRRFTTGEVLTLQRQVRASGVLQPLQDRLEHSIGRPRAVTVEAFVWATLANGKQRHHQGHIIELARTLNSLTPSQLSLLGVNDHDESQTFDGLDRLFNELCDALEDGWDAVVDGAVTRIDVDWYGNQLIQPSLANLPATSRSVAVDDTDVPTWGALHGELLEGDVDAIEDYPEPDEAGSAAVKRRGRKRRARVLSVGPDGRKVYTKDKDARGGHRSATNSRPAGPYVGHALHLAVQTRDVVSHNAIDEIRLGPDVPPVVKAFSLAPAGSHRAKAFVPTLIAAKERGHVIEDVVVDRGYSYLRAETLAHPLNRAGMHLTFRPMKHQRNVQPFRDDIVLIEGQPFSSHLPKNLWGPLPMPPMSSSDEECETYEEAFNRRARYRFQRHAGPDAEGTTRHRCPIHSGLLRSRQVPTSMRANRDVPLAELPEGETCCNGIVSVSAAELPLWQRIPAGTTAWRISFRRRLVVENANGGLKGGFVNIERKFLRVMGRVKMTVLLAATIFGYNLECIRAFTAKMAAEQATKKAAKRTRKKRVSGWTRLLGHEQTGQGETGFGPDPPLA